MKRGAWKTKWGFWLRRKYPLVKKANFLRYKGSHHADVSRGIAEMAAAIRENRPCRLSARYALHVNEIVLAIQNPLEMKSPRRLESTFDTIDPMPWATL